jgi:pimeloyl-ACP methyl ester carboxylesterase
VSSGVEPLTLPELIGLSVFWTLAGLILLTLRHTIPSSIRPQTDGRTHPELVGEPVRFQATDQTWISALLFPQQARGPWVILCHPAGAGPAYWSPILEPLLAAGYNLLLLRFRGHRPSQGLTTSFGWHEQRDLEGALAFLGKQPEVGDAPIGVLGISSGASAAALVAARDERVAAIVLDSLVTDPARLLAERLRSSYGVPSIVTRPLVRAICRARWPKFTPAAMADAVSAIGTRAILAIQGTADPVTPAAQGTQLFDPAGDRTHIWSVTGAGHGQAVQLDATVYVDCIIRFFDAYLGTASSAGVPRS